MRWQDAGCATGLGVGGFKFILCAGSLTEALYLCFFLSGGRGRGFESSKSVVLRRWERTAR